MVGMFVDHYLYEDRMACEDLLALYDRQPELRDEDAALFESGAAGIG